MTDAEPRIRGRRARRPPFPRSHPVHPPRNDDGREEEEEVRRRIRLGRPLFDLVAELTAERDVGSLALLLGRLPCTPSSRTTWTPR